MDNSAAAGIPQFSPVRLADIKTPFNDPDWIFEVKYDGFRSLAYIEPSGVRLVSRNGNVYRAFSVLCAQIAKALPDRQIILDGEIVHLAPDGRPMFYDLLRRRGPQHFYAFDLLWLDGRDLRDEPLYKRKQILRKLIPPQPCPLLYADHIEAEGSGLFQAACQRDLEGIVAKWKHGRYEANGPFRVGRNGSTWVKIRNPDYTQTEGRRELFQKRISNIEHTGL